MRRLQDELWNRGQPVGYVSFLSALVHHGVIVEGLTSVQVASPDRAGPGGVTATPVEHHLLPRDLWFGYREESFEGEIVPVASPEKALIDWCWLAEEQGLYPRLEEMEWSMLDRERLDRLAVETGISYRRLLPPQGASRHDQARLRAEVVSLLR
jgi:predicted transcriptional regulator of viral defense system